MASSLYVENIDGVNKPIFFSEECFRSAIKYKFNPGDVVIATYPKCGTTWMQFLVLNILRKGEPFEKPRDFFLASPFLEQLGPEDSVRMMIKPGVFKTHLPFDKLHWSPDVKYIYVARNPKDCCISFYNHMKQIPPYQFDETFDKFLEMFVEGNVEFGNYFDHLIPWYNVRNSQNVFFVTFEEMSRDIKTITEKIIEFIGGNYQTFFKENPHMLDTILHNCSFPVMRTYFNDALSYLYDENSEQLLKDPNIPKGRKHIIAYTWSLPQNTGKSINFMRKGRVGAWKEEMSAQQNKLLNEMIQNKTKNSDVMNLWSGQA